jgi:DNA-binding transcriptional MerR regulator
MAPERPGASRGLVMVEQAFVEQDSAEQGSGEQDPVEQGSCEQSPGDHGPGDHGAQAATDGLLKIGDFAKAAGTNLRTLRYYEEIRLLSPASRSQGGFRYYRPSDVHRLGMIHDLQELGLPLERIRELMGSREGDEDRGRLLSRVRSALDEQDRLLSARIQGLEEQRGRIADARAKIAECEQCKHRPRAANNYCEPCRITGESLPPKVSALF